MTPLGTTRLPWVRSPPGTRWQGPPAPSLSRLGTSTAGRILLVLHRTTGLVGAGWMVVGVSVCAWYRRRHDLPLSQTIKVVTPEPLGVEEVEYKSILVVFEDDVFSEEAMATAA